MTTGKAIRLALALALMAGAAPLVAQTRITPDEFLDEAEGRTLNFHEFRTGQLVGVEQFLSRSRTVWRQGNAGCVYGDVTIENGTLCFWYEDFDSKPCWATFRHRGKLMVRLVSLSKNEIQYVRDITDIPVACENTPMS